MRFIRLFLCTVLLAFCFPVDLLYSQNPDKVISGLLKSLKNEKEIDVTLDMSRVKIHGYSESDFVYRESLSSDRDWPTLWENEYKPDLILDFMNALNLHTFDYGYSVRFGDFGQAKYQIRIVVKFILPKGSTKMQVFVEDNERQWLLLKFDIIGEGGYFGSKVNLMSDGFKSAGKDLAKQMHYVFKNGKVRKYKNRTVKDKSIIY